MLLLAIHENGLVAVDPYGERSDELANRFVQRADAWLRGVASLTSDHADARPFSPAPLNVASASDGGGSRSSVSGKDRPPGQRMERYSSRGLP
jgi:hypothetical protein